MRFLGVIGGWDGLSTTRFGYFNFTTPDDSSDGFDLAFKREIKLAQGA